MSGYDNREINPSKIIQSQNGNDLTVAVQPFKVGRGDYAAAICVDKESAVWLHNQVAPILLNCLKEHELTHLRQYDQIASRWVSLKSLASPELPLTLRSVFQECWLILRQSVR